MSRLCPEDRKILAFMLDHSDMSPRQVAARFMVPVEHIHDILKRDLAEVLESCP